MIGIYKGGRVLVATLLIAAAFGTAGVALTAATATPAYAALCAGTPIEGTWHNINSNTPAMGEAVIAQDCHVHMTGSTPVRGQCNPTCDWGTVVATDGGSGWLFATYHMSTFSYYRYSHVWLKTYDFNGRTYLRVYVDNRFSHDGTAQDIYPDYVTDEWFLK